MNYLSLYFGKFTNFLQNFGLYFSNTGINYLYKKKIKYLTNIPEISKINLNLQYNYINLTIKNLHINQNIPNYIKCIKIAKIYIFIYPFNKQPLIIYKISDLEISINSNIFNYEQINNQMNSHNNRFNNVNKIIEDSINILDKFINIFTYNQKVIVKNININLENFVLNIKNTNISKKGLSIDHTFKTITLRYDKNIFAKIKSIKFLSRSKKELYINDLYIQVNDVLDTNSILKFIKNIEVSQNDNDLNLFFVINKLNFNLKNRNNLNLNIDNIQSDLKKFIGSDKIVLKCFKKKLVLIEKQIYYFDSKQLEFEIFDINVYKSSGHKLYLSLSKYIKKHKIKLSKNLKKNDKFEIKIDKNYINNIKIDDKNENNKINHDEFENSSCLEKSYIVSSNKLNYSDIFENFIVLFKAKIYITRSKIKLINDIKNFTSTFINENLIIQFNSKSNFNITNTNLIIKHNNKVILKKLSSNKKTFINMTYKYGKLLIRQGYTYFNIITIFFKNTSEIIDKNVSSFMHLFYYNYTKDQIIDNFCIKYFKLDPIRMKVCYYPKNCNYYNIFMGNFGEAYRIISYKDVEINTKCVIIHYPYNMTEIFKKIFKLWINDICENQKENVLAGTKLDRIVKNPKNYLRSFFSSIEKAISVGSDFLIN